MKALKIFIQLLIGVAVTQEVHSQYYFYNDRYYNANLHFEGGIGIGAMNSITDIGGANTDNAAYFNEIRQKNNRLSTSIYASLTHQGIIGVRLEATRGQVESADSTITGKSKNLVSKYIRNLSFRSKILEASLTMELHPLQLLDFEVIPFVSPYVIAGVGYFHFNPQAYFNGQWVDLQPLRTEGQGFSEYPDRKPYNLSQFNVPLGVGIKYELNQLFNIRVEFVHRRLFTDYLDDASTKDYINKSLFSKYLSPEDAAKAKILFNRSIDGSTPIYRGNSKNEDAFMSMSVKLGFAFGRKETESSTGRGKLRCFR